MKLEIVPSLYPDFQTLGKATHFDLKRFAGFAFVTFENGAELKLPFKIFEHSRFDVGSEKVVKVRGGAIGQAEKQADGRFKVMKD